MFEMFKVLLMPGRAFSHLDERNTPQALTSYLSLEFLFTLTLAGAFYANATQAIARNPIITASDKPMIVACAIGIGAIGGVAILACVAGIFQLVMRVFGASVSYRKTLCTLLFASVPELVGHALRSAGYLTGLHPDINHGALLLSVVLPAHLAAIIGALSTVFDVFDVWTMGLVVYGFSITSGLGKIQAILVALSIWGITQLLYFRLVQVVTL